MLKDFPVELPLRIESVSVSKGGAVETSGGEGAGTASISVTRRRLIERRHGDNALGGRLSYAVKEDRMISSVNGAEQSEPGPLDGLTLLGDKDSLGRWVFSPRSGSLVGSASSELDLLAAFENHRWLPGKEVEIGESWRFTPGFIRASLRRDVASAQVAGVMVLRAVEKRSDGTRQAVIDCSIRGGGREESEPGKEVSADGVLVGVMTVNLDKPGLVTWHLAGTLRSAVSKGAREGRAKVPVEITLNIRPLAD